MDRRTYCVVGGVGSGFDFVGPVQEYVSSSGQSPEIFSAEDGPP